MTYTYENLINSIADQLARLFPDGNGGCRYPVRQSPALNAGFPCFFIFPVLMGIEDELSGIGKRESQFDIVYVQQRNIPDQNADIMAVQETLDEGFRMLTYSDGETTWPLHVYERSSSIDDQELHYKITLRQRVSVPKNVLYMQELEETNVEIKDD